MSFKDSLANALGIKPKEGETEVSDDELAKKFAEAVTKNPPPPPNPDPNPAPNPEPVPLNDLTEEQFRKVLSDLRRNDDQASRSALAQLVEEMHQRGNRLEATIRLQEAHGRIRTLSEGRGYSLTVPQQESLLQILVKAPKELSDEIFKLFIQVKDTGMVELRELGSTQADVVLSDMSDPVKALNDGVARKMQENGKLDYSNALREFSREKPEVYAAYRQAVDLNRGVNA